jgi:hypothetical protein
MTMAGSNSNMLFLVFSEMLLVFVGVAADRNLSSVVLYLLENQLENGSMELWIGDFFHRQRFIFVNTSIAS